MYRKLTYANVARMLADLELGDSATDLAAKYKVSSTCIWHWRRFVGLNEDWIRYVSELESHSNSLTRKCRGLARQVDAGAQVIQQLESVARQRSKMVPMLQVHFQFGRVTCNRIMGLSAGVGCKRIAIACDKAVMTNIREYMADNPSHTFARMAHVILRDTSYKRRDAIQAYVGMRDRLASGIKNIGLPKRVRKRMDIPGQLNQVWSMDFLLDVLPSGKRFWVLNVIDDFNREAVLIEVFPRHTAAAVVAALGKLSATGRVPRAIRSDNGGEADCFVRSLLRFPDSGCRRSGSMQG